MVLERRAPIQKLPSARWLEIPTVDVRRNLAMEEAIFWSNQGIAVRLWENQRSIIIGRGQYAPFETDLDYCTANEIPVVRRFTGGGAVYNGPGNLNWSFFVTSAVDSGMVRFERGVREIFRMASAVVAEALKRLGVTAWLDEPNRILTAEGKVSGMAAFLTRDRLLCHGTLLLDADLVEAQLLTKPRELPVESKYVRSRPAGMANVGVDSGAFGRALREVLTGRDGVASAWSGEVENAEIELADGLMTKYSSRSWNLGDPFEVGGS